MTMSKLFIGDLRKAIKDLPSKMAIELHVMDKETEIKMAGHLEFFSTGKDEGDKTVLRIYASAQYLGGMS